MSFCPSSGSFSRPGHLAELSGGQPRAVNSGQVVTRLVPATCDSRTAWHNRGGPDSLMRPCILLVDDKQENLLALEALLADTGWDLRFARSGDEALRALLTADFAAIVLDMHMPGMRGTKTPGAVRSRERSRHTAILMLTAS